MVVDLIRELPGSPEDRLAIANARIAQFFSARNINITWSLESDSAAAEMSVAQADGQPITAWPTSVTGVLFHEGAWLFLDGGSLDLGLVRDSTLNSTNDYRIFAETFEGTAFVGVESDAITLDICPDGSSSATVDIAPCTTGS